MNPPIPPTISMGTASALIASSTAATSGIGASGTHTTGGEESPRLDVGCPCAAVTASPDRTLLAVGGKEGNISPSCLVLIMRCDS